MKSPAYLIPASVTVLLHGALFFNGTPGKPPFSQPTVAGPPVLVLEPIPMPPPEPPKTIVEVIAQTDDSATAPDIDPLPEWNESPTPTVFCTKQLGLPEIPPTEINAFVQPPSPNGPGGALGPGIGVRPNLGPIGVAGLDRTPETRLQVPPRYPHDMRRQGREASVEVEFVVNRQGRVVSATADPHAPREFARAAEDAVKRWKFEPGRRNGQRVSFRMTVPIVFSLDRI